MNALRSRSSSAAATVALFLLCGQVIAQGYSAQALPPLPGHTESFACGINESGVVVGVSRPGRFVSATTRETAGLAVTRGRGR